MNRTPGGSDGGRRRRRDVVLAGLGFGALGAAPALAAESMSSRSGSTLPYEGTMPPLARAAAWLNSPALSREDLRGKTVLVNFWTYSCINWMRAHPYVRAWSHAYADKGLVVIGVHTPEFDFEHDVGNVRRAATANGIDYPVAIDNDTTIWRAFSNEYWPALYLVDSSGRIRHHRFGEGGYDSTEDVIRQLLALAGSAPQSASRAQVTPTASELAADWPDLRTPETYLGYARAERFASRGGVARRQSRLYSIEEAPGPNQWALSGIWTVGEQRVTLNEPGGRLAYRFHARDAHLVMGPSSAGTPRRFRVLVDGQPPGPDRGVDVDAMGLGIADGPRLYQLLRQHGPIVDRQLEVEFLDRDVDLYSLTFG